MFILFIILKGLLEKIPFRDLITKKSSVKKVDKIVFPWTFSLYYNYVQILYKVCD